MSLDFAFLKNIGSTYLLFYSLAGKKSVKRSMEAVSKEGEMLYIP